jgi:hypothetical protein
VDIRGVDPRDTRWEIDEPAFRVYFWQAPVRNEAGLQVGMWVSDEYEVTGADILEVISWAYRHAGAHLSFVVYVLVPSDDGPGLVRIHGTDPTSADATTSLTLRIERGTPQPEHDEP